MSSYFNNLASCLVPYINLQLSFYCGWPIFGFQQFGMVNEGIVNNLPKWYDYKCPKPDLNSGLNCLSILEFEKRPIRPLSHHGWIIAEKSKCKAEFFILPNRFSDCKSHFNLIS